LASTELEAFAPLLPETSVSNAEKLLPETWASTTALNLGSTAAENFGVTVALLNWSHCCQELCRPLLPENFGLNCC
jgi:hypothetical protein